MQEQSHFQKFLFRIIFVGLLCVLPACLDATEIKCCLSGPCLDDTLLVPTSDLCRKIELLNGSTVQTTLKAIYYTSTKEGLQAGTIGLFAQSGYICRFPDCYSNPCLEGECLETLSGYICNCSSGFQGKHCEIYVQWRDCSEFHSGGVNVSGVYTLYLTHGLTSVYCDMDTDGGGWTVFQRREDGSVDFNLTWADYKRGFGQVSSEHWLGNDNINMLTSQGPYELRVDLEDFSGETRFAKYSQFSISGEDYDYTLLISGYSGDAGDSLDFHTGQPFTTKDRDNDGDGTNNCAELFPGGWWFKYCLNSNLNGIYHQGPNITREARGVVWKDWLGFRFSLKKTEMKIRAL